MKKLLISISCLIISVTLYCQEESTSGTFRDDVNRIDYKWIKIGEQVWMAEDLHSIRLQDGYKLIGGAVNLSLWFSYNEKMKPLYIYPSNDKKLGKVGLLYNWYAVVDPRKLCPDGWHIPTKEEWDQLINFLGGPEQAYTELIEPGLFNVNFLGILMMSGDFFGKNKIASWWTASMNEDYTHIYTVTLSSYNNKAIGNYELPKSGYSIRCIKD